MFGISQDETHLNISKGGSAPKGCGDPSFSNSRVHIKAFELKRDEKSS